MAFHPLHKLCDDCGRVLVFRRPTSVRILVRILPHLPCHHCHPERFKDVCPSCRYPLRLLRNGHGTYGAHAGGLCYTCYVSLLRFRALQKPSAQ